MCSACRLNQTILCILYVHVQIISPQVHILDNGQMFPFLHSTDVYPEWPIGALDHVSKDVSFEVQEALMNLEAYAKVGQALTQCVVGGGDVTGCQSAVLSNSSRCETNQALAKFSWSAAQTAQIAGFRTLRSYYKVDEMLQVAGFSKQNDQGHLVCTRGNTYDIIECPLFHYKVTEAEFKKSCANIGLTCKKGFDCYCSPCIKAFEVSVFESISDTSIGSSARAFNATASCAKMSTCGIAEQTRLVTFSAIDHKQRIGANASARVYVGETTLEVPVTKIDNENFTYTFNFSQDKLGVAVMEIYFDGEQIPESPLRVEIIARNCNKDFPGKNMVPDETGTCLCGSGMMEMGSKCVR
jgi:hypothetical protein